jgi:hypothetical protein
MDISTEDLIQAKEAAAALLEDLGLTAYVFEVEPRAPLWEVRVDCAFGEGWQTVILAVDKDRLLASRRNALARTQLLADWRGRLAACRFAGSGLD